MKTSSNATTRFSSRVDDYIKYRPHYPVAVLDLLAAQCGLLPESVIADIGSGTGILTRLFLENGNPVMGVEPNADMREAAETYLADYARFTSLTGTAEATKLPAQSMDFVLAGQAFHWFDRQKARTEFLRILKPEGWVVLLWNDRQIDTTPFLGDYEALLQQYGTDYQEINHKNVQSPDVFQAFFGGTFREACFDNAQHFDFDGMMGRINSSSYVPAKDHPNYPLMVARAREIFDLHQQNGRISFLYDTRVYYGRLL